MALLSDYSPAPTPPFLIGPTILWGGAASPQFYSRGGRGGYGPTGPDAGWI